MNSESETTGATAANSSASDLAEASDTAVRSTIHADRAVFVGTSPPTATQKFQPRRQPIAADDRTKVEEEDETIFNPLALPQGRKCTPLWLPPVQRQKWGDTQILPHVNWGDLFFDLFYVGAAYNLGNILKDSPSRIGILYFLGCFAPVLQFWTDRMHFDSRFAYEDDIFHRFYEILQLCALATAVLHIRPVSELSHPSEDPAMFIFCLNVTIGMILAIGRYVEIYFFVIGQKAAKIVACHDVFLRSVSTVWFAAATIVSGIAFYKNDDDYNDSSIYSADSNGTLVSDAVGHLRLLASTETTATTTSDYDSSTNYIPIWLCIIGFLMWPIWRYVTFIFCVPQDHTKVTVPMNIDFTIHRYGEWTMLMLGESVLSLVIVDISEGVDYFVTFYAGVLSVIMMQYLHFRSQPHTADGHAMRRNRYAGVTFSVLMQVYSAALVAIGSSYKMFLYEYTYENSSSDGSMHRVRRRELSVQYSLARELQRFLAGSSSSGPQYSSEERQQRIANLFCGSMAVCWVCLDLMVLSHKGLWTNVDRCKCKHTHKVSVSGASLVLARIGLIAFIATLSRYETNPQNVALIGFAAIVAQVVLRVVGCFVFPAVGKVHVVSHDGEESGPCDIDREKYNPKHEENEEENVSEDDEVWPNVTYARSRPEKETTGVDED